MNNEMRLQGIGIVEGRPAGEIKVNDVLMWNFGTTSEVVNITYSKTRKTMIITTKYFDSWAKEYKLADRKITTSRLVCILNNGKYTLIQ